MVLTIAGLNNRYGKKHITLIISRFFTTGDILAKGDCIISIKFGYFSNRSNNSVKVKVLITGLLFSAMLGNWQAKS